MSNLKSELEQEIARDMAIISGTNIDLKKEIWEEKLNIDRVKLTQLNKIVEMIKENPVEVYCEDKNDGIIVKQAIEIFRKSILAQLQGDKT